MLHGEVMVNGRVIGKWYARRLVHPPSTERNEYECLVSMDGEQVEFNIWHTYGHGAAMLAATVLFEGGRLLHPRLAGKVPP